MLLMIAPFVYVTKKSIQIFILGIINYIENKLIFLTEQLTRSVLLSCFECDAVLLSFMTQFNVQCVTLPVG